MVIIIDSKIFLYHAIQRGRLSVEMFELIADQIIKAMPQAYKKANLKQPKVSSVLFVGDLGKSEYRLNLISLYKTNRKHKADYSEAMSNYVGVIPNLAATLDWLPVFIQGVEADDIGGILTNYLTSKDHPVLLITNDRDWLQLGLRFPNTYIKFSNYPDVLGYEDLQMFAEVTDWFEFLLKKAIIGDLGDAIMGFHRVGEIKFYKFLNHIKQQNENYDSLTAYQKYELVLKHLDFFKDTTPHPKYLALNPNMTLQEALRLNFKLGEIMVSPKYLNDNQKSCLKSYITQIDDALKKPIKPNFKAFDKTIEEQLPNEKNDFGYPYNLPNYIKVNLSKSLGLL